MMGELLDMDVVNVPTYDWLQAASTSIRMAARITGRKEALVANTISPERLSAITTTARGTSRLHRSASAPRQGG